MQTKLAVALGVLMLMTGSLSAGEPEKAPGERIVFLGDSITQAGAGPQGYVTLVRAALKEKHPGFAAEVIGAGRFRVSIGD